MLITLFCCVAICQLVAGVLFLFTVEVVQCLVNIVTVVIVTLEAFCKQNITAATVINYFKFQVLIFYN